MLHTLPANIDKRIPRDAYIVTDEAGVIVHVSKKWLDEVNLIEGDKSDLIGQNLIALCNDRLHPRVTFLDALNRETLCSGNSCFIDILEECLRTGEPKNEQRAVISYTTPEFSTIHPFDLLIDCVHKNNVGIIVYHRYQDHDIQISSGLPLDREFYSTLFENLEDGIIYQNLEGYIELANKSAQHIFGFSLEREARVSIFSDRWVFLSSDGDELSPLEHPLTAILVNMKPVRGEVVGVRKYDDLTVWLSISVDLVCGPNSDVPHGLLISFSDITAESVAKRELQSVSEKLNIALDGASMGIWDWYVKKDHLIWDDQMYKLCGISKRPNMSVNETWLQVSHPDDVKRVQAAFFGILKSKKDESIDSRLVLENGEIRHVRSYARPVISLNGEIERVVGMVWDITKEVTTEEKMSKIAFFDELTHLPNRQGFKNQINTLVAHCEKSKKSAGLLVVDIDRFKDINDSFGHPIGDALIQEVCAHIKTVLSKREYLARIGGDEFAIICDRIESTDDTYNLAMRVQASLAQPIYLLSGQVVSVKLSIGVAHFPRDGDDAVSLIKAADLAMHQAKKSGRDSVVTYEKAFSKELASKLYLEGALRQAIRDEVLTLYYQPIINLETKKIVGCEALLRWFDADGTFISPMEFVPVAEEAGLIVSMGHWINATVFKQLKLWQVICADLEYISINVSPHQLQDPNFLEDLKKLLHLYDVNPKEIQLEITEGTFLQESMSTSSQLEELSAMGFRLAIDDFGTGYSSLAYLKRFNVDVIKIDRSFIIDLEHDQADKDIVKAIIAMTKSLGFETLVEGVESKEQSLIVSALGCGYGQGYLYGRPTFADDFAENYIDINSCDLPRNVKKIY